MNTTLLGRRPVTLIEYDILGILTTLRITRQIGIHALIADLLEGPYKFLILYSGDDTLAADAFSVADHCSNQLVEFVMARNRIRDKASVTLYAMLNDAFHAAAVAERAYIEQSLGEMVRSHMLVNMNTAFYEFEQLGGSDV